MARAIVAGFATRVRAMIAMMDVAKADISMRMLRDFICDPALWIFVAERD